MQKSATRLVVGALTAAVLTGSGIAAARTIISYAFSGDMAQSAVSGHSSSDKKGHFAPNPVTGMSGLSMWEVSDQAIAFQVHQQKLSPIGDDTSEGNVIKFAGYSKSSKKTVTLGKGEYVDAVKICTSGDKRNTAKKRLKGVKLYGARVKEDGSIQSGVSTAKFERANCKQWEKKVACPKGQLADAIWMYRGDRGINGVSLRCRAVERKESVGR